MCFLCVRCFTLYPAGHAFPERPPGWYGNFLITSYIDVSSGQPEWMWCRETNFMYTYELVRAAFDAAGLEIHKATHAFRGSGSRIALESGCTLKDVECLSHWNMDKMRQCYTQICPVDATVLYSDMSSRCLVVTCLGSTSSRRL